MSTKRKPYIREMDCCWWKKNPFYRFYMLREGTCVFSIWISLLLLLFLFAPASFTTVIKNPIICLLNLAALLASLLHSKTWFELTPKALNLPADRLDFLVKGLQTATIAFSVLVLALSLL
ncbi:MAG: hypothetical protein LBN28_01725 [Desulfovibrio sp.]|nr:hypothetical protein [Desulfovibrio sp.]